MLVDDGQYLKHSIVGIEDVKMTVTICIMFLLICLGWVAAQGDGVDNRTAVVQESFLIIGLILASACVTFGLIFFIYFTFKFIKSRTSEAQYYIDETIDHKDPIEYSNGTYNIYSNVPNINQIPVSLNVPHILRSIREALIDLYISLKPFNLSQAQQSAIAEKSDSRI